MYLAFANEIVKYEQSLIGAPTALDYEASQQSERYAEIKSMLATAGFTYTELNPHNSTPNPDDDSANMQ